MRAIILAVCLVCVSVCCLPLYGSVSSGYIQITGSIPVGDFALSGRGFNAYGRFGSGVWNPVFCSYGCTEGSVLSVNGYVMGYDFGDGSATIDGISFPHVNWGDFYAQGSSEFWVSGPGITLNHGAGTYFGTFYSWGSLCGTIDYSGECAAQLGLSGSGRVAVDLDSYNYDGQTMLVFRQATYTFLTPEPGTMVLLGSGIVGVASVLRRRFKI